MYYVINTAETGYFRCKSAIKEIKNTIMKMKSSRNKSQNKERYFLIAYVLFFFVVASSIALFQPLANTPPTWANPPDEHARYLIPQFICKYGKIPTGFEEEIRIPGYGFSYAFYNVFPYIVMGYVMRFVSLFTDSPVTLLYTARFINVLSGTLMAVMIYKISKKVFSDRRFGWLFCFAVMFLPQSLFMHTYVNTDSMCLLSTSLILYGLICAWQDGFNYKNSVWLSAGIILCALSYYNAYGFILSSIFLLLAYFYTGTKNKFSYDYKGMLKWGSLISVIVLAGIGWWFIRSYILFDGDILGLKTRELCAIQYAIPEVNPLYMSTYQAKGYTVTEMLRETDFFNGIFISFVATLGSMSIVGNIWIYRLYKLFFCLGLGGYYLLIPKYAKKSNFKNVFFHINMSFCIIMPLILAIHYAYTMDFQNQGRYLMPMLLPLMYYTVKGFERIIGLFPKIPKKWGTAVVGTMMMIVIVILLLMVYYYAFPLYLETGLVL